MKKNVFKMPTPVTIMGRSASITNSFVNGIIPAHKPTNAEIQEALNVLHQNEDDVRCVYCGDKKNRMGSSLSINHQQKTYRLYN